MRRMITWILVLAVVGVLGSDIWIYSKAAKNLNEATYDLSRWALGTSGAANRDQVAAQLVQQATPYGVRVYQYDQNDNGVRLWTEDDVSGTIVLGTVWNMITGVAPNEAFGKPFVIRDYGEAGI